MKLDILYLAWNRRQYTEFSWRMLMENTNWALVNHLHVHDDKSDDGTFEFLKGAVGEAPVGVHLTNESLRSPPAVMNRYVARSDAEWFAKIDNDIVVPPNWLEAMIECAESEPEAAAIGMEAGRGLPVTTEWDGQYRFEMGSHMGGVGLIRVDALASRVQLNEQTGRYGWTEFQHEYGRSVRNGPLLCGWINPDLPVVSLDRVPFSPWDTLAEMYSHSGWQRPWGKYHERADYWDWWPKKK